MKSKTAVSKKTRSTKKVAAPANKTAMDAILEKCAARLAAADQSLQSYFLPNGCEVIFVPMANRGQFYLQTFFKVGARQETAAQSGISHLLEHLIFRGSSKHPVFIDLAQAFEKLGGEWNAATAHEHTEYYYSGLNAHFESILELFADFLSTPQFNDLETEKEIIFREIEGDLNEHGHHLDLIYHVNNLFWPGSSLALPLAGNKEAIAAVTLEDLKRYHRTYYGASNMKICIAGDFEAAALKSMIDQHFSAYPIKTKPPVPNEKPLISAKGPHYRWVDNTDNQIQICLAFLCEGRDSPLIPYYEILSRILSDGYASLLYRELREKRGLAYEIDTELHFYREFGCLMITSMVNPSQLDIFMDSLHAILADLIAHGVDEIDWQRCRNRSLYDLTLLADDLEHSCFFYGYQRLMNSNATLSSRFEQICGASRKQLHQVIKTLFRKEKIAYVFVGPETSEFDPRKKYAQIL